MENPKKKAGNEPNLVSPGDLNSYSLGDNQLDNIPAQEKPRNLDAYNYPQQANRNPNDQSLEFEKLAEEAVRFGESLIKLVRDVIQQRDSDLPSDSNQANHIQNGEGINIDDLNEEQWP